MKTEPRVGLVEAARRGDRDAFGQLVDAFQRPVYALAFRMLGNADDAEDAAQEAFMKAYRALGGYDAGRSFSTWLLSITAHHCIDRIRRRKPDPLSLDDLPPWKDIAAPAVDPERAAIAADQADWMSGLLAHLSEADRLVLVLRYWHDLGYQEIAEMTETSEAAVKSRLHRARRQLAVMMSPRAAAGTDALAPSVAGQDPAYHLAAERSEPWKRTASPTPN